MPPHDPDSGPIEPYPSVPAAEGPHAAGTVIAVAIALLTVLLVVWLLTGARTQPNGALSDIGVTDTVAHVGTPAPTETETR